MKSFHNKVAVITGAARGIGEAIARECAHRNMKLVLADINQDKLLKLEQELIGINKNIISVIIDVSDKSDITNLATTTLSKFGAVHILFNNAGIAGPLGAIWEVDETKLQQVIDINLMSVIYGLRTFVPIMLKQREDCYIVNTSSGAGLHTSSNMSGYMATKHAVVALSEVLYFDLEQRKANINVSVLCPGMVVSDLTTSMQVKENAPQKVKEQAEYLKKLIKSGMPGQEVAKQVFAAIEANQFYILTHYDEHKILIENRMRNLLNKHNPTIVH
jgi:NAD(P)-dependent dehydrogenase (short-subunit alcohol dehydrogenase family)